jgi:hypothetical protein
VTGQDPEGQEERKAVVAAWFGHLLIITSLRSPEVALFGRSSSPVPPGRFAGTVVQLGAAAYRKQAGAGLQRALPAAGGPPISHRSLIE